MTQTLQPKQRNRASFQLFEEFSEAVVGWELDFRQLGRIDGAFFLEQFAGSQVLFSRAFFPCGFYQLGGVAPDYRTVSLLAGSSDPIDWRWCGERVTHNSLLVMPVGGEFESVSAPGFDSIHLALSIELLEHVAENQFRMALGELMPDGRCFCANGGVSLVRLRASLERLSVGRGTTPRQPALLLTPAVEAELAYLVLSCLSEGGAGQPRGPRSKRMKTLASALDIIDTCDLREMSVPSLVSATGVSRRTLENAFRDGFGAGPSAYIKALRLSEINSALWKADASGTSVAEIARAHGVSHLGQFAADYREMYGLLPSATLRKTSRV